MLWLFEEDKNYGQGVEYKPIRPLRELSSKALSILHERGHVRVMPKMLLGEVTPSSHYSGIDAVELPEPIEYRAVYQYRKLAGAYIHKPQEQS
jgi:hypothetical protein